MSLEEVRALLESRTVVAHPCTPWAACHLFVERGSLTATVVELSSGSFFSVFLDPFTCAVGTHATLAAALEGLDFWSKGRLPLELSHE